MPYPACPECGRELKPNCFPYGNLNHGQWMAVRAGDYYCKHCLGTRCRDEKRYFFKHELLQQKTA